MILRFFLVLLFNEVRNQCLFDSFDYNQCIECVTTYFQEIQYSDLNSQNDQGIGLWFKYLPFSLIIDDTEILDDRTKSRNFFYQNNQAIIRKDESLIFSMLDQSTSNSVIILSHFLNKTSLTFQHNIYINYENMVKKFNINSDYLNYEGKWFVFYLFFDQIAQRTNFGIFDQNNNHWETVECFDQFQLPKQYEFHIGGKYQLQKLQSEILMFNQFYGMITPIFTSGTINYFILEDIDDCLIQFEQIKSFQDQDSYELITQNFYGNQSIASYISLDSFDQLTLNGWVKLDASSEQEKTSTIFYLNLDLSFIQENFGNKQFELLYFQSIEPELNGFQFTINYFILPIPTYYQNFQTSKIKHYNKDFFSLWTKWHNIQFIAKAPSNNNQPLFIIFSPEQGSYYYKWDDYILYSSKPSIQFLFGGDDQKKTYLSGKIYQFYIFFQNYEIDQIIINCHQSCKTCDGPTMDTCLSCNQDSNRVYEQLYQTCQCHYHFIDIKKICYNIFTSYNITILGEDLQPLQSKCNFGYVFVNRNCFLCPYYEVYLNQTKILCADCYFNPDRFSIDMKCTYDYLSYQNNQDYTYNEYTRYQNEIEQYHIDIEGKQFIPSHYTKFQQCDNLFVQVNQTCVTIQNCNNITLTHEFEVICLNCNDGFYLQNNECQICGTNCQYCDSYKICHSCINSSQYYITFDGQNCQKCQIQNCLFCFQYYYLNNQLYSTIDKNFQFQSLNSLQMFEGCAQCKDGYFFNFKINQCELKCNYLSNQDGKSNCLQNFNDCLFGAIYLDNTITCIRSISSPSSISSQQCKQHLNCLECFNQNDKISSSCIICNDGYYVELITNLCIPCPQKCKKCAQFNNFQQDNLEIQTKSFSVYLLSLNSKQFYFNYFDNNYYENDLEIVCIECQQGFVLFKNKCIKDCEKFCRKCEIINGISTCVQCPQTSQGYLKAKLNESSCIECPNNCAACSDRRLDEIKQHNPYFLLNKDNARFTRKCCQLFDQSNEQNAFIDSFNLVVICDERLKQCYNKITIPIELGCSDISSIFYLSESDGIDLFEDQYSEYLNYVSAQEVELQFQVNPKRFDWVQENNTCSIYDSFRTFTRLQRKVFSLKKVSVNFVGYFPNVSLEFQGLIGFYNFSSVIFTNITLRFTSQQQFQFKTLSNNFTLQFKNCLFTYSNFEGLEIFSQFNFIVDKPFSLIFENVLFDNLKVVNSTIFSQDFNENSLQAISIYNFTFRQSVLINATLFYFIQEQNSQAYTLQFLDITFYASNFTNSSFLWIESSLAGNQSNVIVQGFHINKNKFTQSIVFRETTIAQFFLKNLEIIETIFQNNNQFFVVFTLNLENIFLKNLSTLNSSFAQLFFYTQNVKMICNNVSFVDISTDNLQPFISQMQEESIQNTSIFFNQLVLSNIHSVQTEKSQNNYPSFMEFQCKFCNFNNIKVLRSYGVTELAISNSISINLKNVEINQIQENLKVLHVLQNCAEQYFLPFTTFMIVQSYKNVEINFLSVKSCFSFNKPLLIFQGTNQHQKTQEEQINILNSNFLFNKNIITSSQSYGCTIELSTKQKSQIQLNNVTFQGNILHSYDQTTDKISSSTIYIDAQNGQVEIIDSKIMQNSATNCSSSNFHVRSFQTTFRNVYFTQNNYLNQSAFLNNILIEKIKYSTLQNLFPIKSKGGNGYLTSTNLIIQNITVIQSLSDLGGCFSVQTSGEGSIYITNSTFQESSTSFLNQSQSQGGCFYFDSSQSNLNLTITHTTINNSQSLKEGGSIYLVPSDQQNVVLLTNLIIQNSFSQQTSFLSFKSTFFQNSKSSIVLKDTKFVQNEQKFDQFYSKFLGLNSKQLPSPSIYISYGNVSLYNVTLTAFYQCYFIQIAEAQFVSFENVWIINGTLINSQFIKISLDKNMNGQVILKKIFIKNIQIQKQKINIDQCSLNQELSTDKVECSSNLNNNYSTYVLDTDTPTEELENLNCNKRIIFQQSQNINNYIELDIFSKKQKIKIIQSSFQNLFCEICKNGIININLNLNQLVQNVEIQDIYFKNSYCGIKGCINIQSDNLYAEQRILQQQIKTQLGFEIANNIDQYQLIIQGSVFTNNSAYYGGALFINKIASLILECKFFGNNAHKGGSIFYSSQTMLLLLIDTQISNNNAQIAGGLYIQNLIFWENQYLYQVVVIENNSSLYGNDISENPTSLTISLDGGQTLYQKISIIKSNEQFIEKIDISEKNALGTPITDYLQFPSGIEIGAYSYFDEKLLKFIPLNLTFRIIALNSLNLQEKSLENSYCTLEQKVMSLMLNEEVTDVYSFLSIKNITFNQTSQDFNLDNLKIYFNPKFSQQYYLRIFIECNMIAIPIYNTEYFEQVTSYHKNYKLIVDVQTYKCQVGEYLNDLTGECLVCDAQFNYYNLVKNASNCTYKDNTLIDQFTSATIQLRQTYWRALNESTEIENCYHLPSNCQGGWLPGDDSCALGHIGGLCEQCDINNIRNQGSFSNQGTYSCGDCNKIAGNVIILIVISLWMIISIFLSVNSTMENIKQEILSNLFHLKRLNVSNQLGILIKLFTNYLQIISILQSFELQIPDYLTLFYTKVGNPITQMSYSYDCFLAPLIDIDINYFRLFWAFTQILFFMICFLSIQFFTLKYQNKQIQIYSVYNSALFIYFYVHFSLITSLISQVTYRIISNIKWVQGNVSIQYVSNSHILWMLEFIIPMLLFFGLLLPLWIFKKIYEIKDRLNYPETLKRWGYLTFEYKRKTFFWDFFKILYKSMIALVLSQYEDVIIVKASLVVIILYGFSLASAKFKPYKIHKINILENSVMQVCTVSIILGSCIYLATSQQKDEIIWIFYFILGFLNILLLLQLLFEILLAYSQKIKEMRSQIVETLHKQLPILHSIFPQLFRLIKHQKSSHQDVQARFVKVKALVMSIVKKQIHFRKLLMEQQNLETIYFTPQTKTIPTQQWTRKEEASISLLKI